MTRTFRSTWSAFALFVCLVTLGACSGATSSDCEQQITACLKRCEAVTDQRGVARNALPPQNTMSECENRCSCRRGPTTPKPQGPPTPTGNTPQ